MSYQAHEPCMACGEVVLDRCYHHLKTRKSGGCDSKFNLIAVCLKCHNQVHQIGLKRFAEKHKSVEFWLMKNGWHIELGKWRHENGQ